MEPLKGVLTPKPNDDVKGLENQKGENNCFLNVVIQALWHLEPFRRRFAAMKGDHKHEDPCAFCALEIIFTQYEFSDEAHIPPTIMRQTMASLFKSSSRFQLFELDDAGELFDELLNCLHFQFFQKKDEMLYQSRRSSSMEEVECKELNCVSHRVFGIQTIEQSYCNMCDTITEGSTSTLFTAFTYAAALRNAYSQRPSASFCQLLKMAGEDIRYCSNRENCNNVVKINHYLKSVPDIFATSIVWDSANPSLNDIDTVLKTLSLRIDLANIFSLEDIRNQSHQSRKRCIYRFRGMICYYGKHYSAYFYNAKTSQWYVFDDTTVKALGGEWPVVRDRCLRGRLQPSVVFYEKEETESLVKDRPKTNLERDFSHIKISNTVHTDIENEIKQSLQQDQYQNQNQDQNQEPQKSPEESFVFISTTDQDKENIDITVTRTNWLYRRQTRRLRFTPTGFLRMVPGTAEVKDHFDYKDILEVTVVDKENLIVKFYSGKEPQYIQSERIDDIIQILTKRCGALQHSFILKKTVI